MGAGGGDGADGTIEVVGLAGEQHQVARIAVRHVRECGHGRGEITHIAVHDEAALAQARGTRGAHEEIHVVTGLDGAHPQVRDSVPGNDGIFCGGERSSDDIRFCGFFGAGLLAVVFFGLESALGLGLFSLFIFSGF